MPTHVQLLKSREEAFAAKQTQSAGAVTTAAGTAPATPAAGASPTTTANSTSALKDTAAKRHRPRSEESESLERVQALGAAFQKLQAATGLHVRRSSSCIAASWIV